MSASSLPGLLLSRRQTRIAWAFLVGAIVTQLIALPFLFYPRAGWIGTLGHVIRRPSGTPVAWCMTAVVTAAYVRYSTRRSPVISEFAFRPASWAPLLGLRLVAIPMAFVTGVFEELFFRKVVMDVAERHGYSAVHQIVISALIFGLAHAIWALLGGKLRAALAVVTATGILGGLLAVVYLLGGRSIAPCIAAHIVMNLFLEPWLVLSSATGSWGRKTLPSAI